MQRTRGEGSYSSLGRMKEEKEKGNKYFLVTDSSPQYVIRFIHAHNSHSYLPTWKGKQTGTKMYSNRGCLLNAKLLSLRVPLRI